MQRDEATQRQIDAAFPGRSTWLSANAGSGKTRVLTDRVARLLLDRVSPQNILCLTYTKAAAGEMQNRLFKRLGAWAMLDDAALSDELRQLGHPDVTTAEDFRVARRLFARAIETPGGLKIQTIHSFCAALLRRFPLEAGVSPQFTEMDERTAAQLRTEIVEEIAAGPESDLLYAVARSFSGESFEDLTAEIVRHRSGFRDAADSAKLAALFNQPADISMDKVLRGVFTGHEQALLERLVPALLANGTNDEKAGMLLARIAGLDRDALPILERVFLTGESAKSPFSAKTGAFPTKACRQGLSDIEADLDAFMLRVEAARESRLACEAIAKSQGLHAFAKVFLAAYDRSKQRRGWLDFDDLILRAGALLDDPRVAEWVLFRLDGGIDHILVDEAQDTSPAQWKVIEKLTQEFTSGQGAREDLSRTIFVVGDKKQSIYSFQGADARAFDRMRDEFATRLSAIETPLQQVELDYSFRSSQAILSLVDFTFQNAEKSGFRPKQGHKAHKARLPGRVDLWPYFEPAEREEKPLWYHPVDIKAANDPSVLLARQIADTIAGLIDGKHPIPVSEAVNDTHPSKAAQPGDFLILVQRRNHLFHEIIRECKSRGLPVAGADRLKIGAELAVRDLTSLLSFLATPEDSYSLAAALKSPLFGWSEADLYDLAHDRSNEYLWAEMRERAADFPRTMQVLGDLRDRFDFLRPYDLIERILTRHDGRRRLLARLGPEAEDGIDALLTQALAYEKQAVDSVTGFLVWLESDDVEIKRQMDNAGNRIRVMTVHGAKGLEAPVVILPDTGKRRISVSDQILVENETALWKTGAGASPQKISQIVAEVKAAELSERDRLLYVAMTRAEKWLIVAAAGEKGSNGETWYEKVEAGMQAAGALPCGFANGPGLRLEYGNWAGAEMDHTSEPAPPPPALDDIFTRRAPRPAASPRSLSPSDLGGAKALPDEAGLDEEAAKRRGRQIHRLLEFLPQLPQAEWPRAAADLLRHGGDAAAGRELSLLLAEATKVLTRPALSHLFRPETLAEVPITANLDILGGRRIHGVIDRLVVGADRILAVDFKTNAAVPDWAVDIPIGLLRQMGAYAHALTPLYPGIRIETAILWTRTASLIPLPQDLVTDALASLDIS